MDLQNVIIRPIITEKSMSHVSRNKFTFEVSKAADKKMVKKAIEQKFGVTVLKVETNILKGRKKRVGAKREEITGPTIKKAMVTLKQGQKIDLFDIGQ